MFPRLNFSLSFRFCYATHLIQSALFCGQIDRNSPKTHPSRPVLRPNRQAHEWDFLQPRAPELSSAQSDVERHHEREANGKCYNSGICVLALAHLRDQLLDDDV